MVETRIAVPGVPGYLVSDLGNVYSLWKREWTGTRGPRGLSGSKLVIDPERPKLLTPFDRKDRKGRSTGYLSVTLGSRTPGGTRTIRYVHELVLLAFVGPRPSPDHEACHGPGGRGDNRLSNLRWGTSRENYEDRVEAGTQYRGEAWRMARGLLPTSLLGTEIEHAFAGMVDIEETAE